VATLLDPAELVGTPLADATSSWAEKDVILYHLGLGAGVPPTSPSELRYVYERDLVVLPAFASVACSPCLRGFRKLPALDLSEVVVLHAEHLVEVPGPIPVSAEVTHSGRLKDLVDRGGGALALFEIETRDQATGALLMRNVATFYLKGLGGFGKEADEEYERISAPSREPDRVSSIGLLPQQAFIYRLSGDLNPLHVDPEVAARAGFPQPLLHGLCTYGVVCKSIADAAADAGAGTITGYRARFTGPVFPGETLESRIWLEGDRAVAEVSVPERDASVLAGTATFAG
jgi:acyl dehydratase